MYTKNLFDGIEEEVIQKTLHNIKTNLWSVAKYNAFHLKKHCAQTDEFLQERIYSENKKAATAFYEDNKSFVERLCYEILKENWVNLEAFLCGNEISITLYKDFNKALGFGYVAGVQGVFEDLHLVRMGINKDENSCYGFVITSAYPIVTRDIVPDESVEWLREE